MKIYNKKEAIEKFNYLAKNGIPFIFAVDYLQEKIIIEQMDDVDASECLFSFNGVCNDSECTINAASDVDLKYDMCSFDEYKSGFNVVKDNIMLGNSYLVNYTCKVPIRLNVSLKEIFKRSNALYKLWVKDEFVCFSPEIFVRIDSNGRISSYPMKGTIDATMPNADKLLLNDAKEAAEHATIVDLIRNDLSMVAGNVNVEKYRYIDVIRTNKRPILQTSSKITGQLEDDYREHLGDILFALFPAGSITGAPKPMTMQIIADAENYERGFYTGVMGYCTDGFLDSAVMIRFIDNEDGVLYFKAGGGITSQSAPLSEYNEVMQKIYVPIY